MRLRVLVRRVIRPVMPILAIGMCVYLAELLHGGGAADEYGVGVLPKDDMFDKALQYIAGKQNDVDCKTADMVQVVSGYDGGVGSKFDHVLRYFMAAVLEGKVVVITGDMDPYSNSTACTASTRKGWSCYFRQPSKCAKEFKGRWETLPIYRASGRPCHPDKKCVDMKPPHMTDVSWEYGFGKDTGMSEPLRETRRQFTYRDNFASEVVPAEFRSKGVTWWLGVMHHYLWQVHPEVETHVAKVKADIGWNQLQGVRRPLICIHIRHGDKYEYKHLPLEAFLEEARQVLKTHFKGAESAAVFLATDDQGIISTLRQRKNQGVVDPALHPIIFQDQLVSHVPDKGFVNGQAKTAEFVYTIHHNEAWRYRAGLEIIADIQMLKAGDAIIGIMPSAPFRIATYISAAVKGFDEQKNDRVFVAMDYEHNLGKYDDNGRCLWCYHMRGPDMAHPKNSRKAQENIVLDFIKLCLPNATSKKTDISIGTNPMCYSVYLEQKDQKKKKG